MVPVRKEGPALTVIAYTLTQTLTLHIHRKRKKPICLYDDIYVSHNALDTYDDEKGQDFMRNTYVNYNAPFLRRPYSPDYDSEFVVTPRHSDSESDSEWED